MMISSHCFGIKKHYLALFYIICWSVLGLQLYILIAIMRYQIYVWNDKTSHNDIIMRVVCSILIIIF